MLKFFISQDNKGFFWRLKFPNGETVLTSNIYSSLANCEKAISLAKILGTQRRLYTRSNSINGSYYFFLKDANGEIIGSSVAHNSESIRNEVIEKIIKMLDAEHSAAPISDSLDLIEFIKDRRKKAGLTQDELAEKAGVGIRFLRELEQGKDTLRLDKVNQVLKLFGHEMQPVPTKKDFE